MDVKRREDEDLEAQEIYAHWLNVGTHAAFAVSLVAVLLYLSGVVPAYVPFEKLPEVWSLPAAQFLQRTSAPDGWGWVALLEYSDYLNYVGIALFASISAACCLRVVPIFLRNGERLHAALALAQLVVLLAAASGWFAGGR
jgi:hypothetical protein